MAPRRPQASKRDRGRKGPAQRGLFDSCPATLEVVAQYTTGPLALAGCPLCGKPAEEHELEEAIAGTVPDDASFGEWMMNLPRTP